MRVPSVGQHPLNVLRPLGEDLEVEPVAALDDLPCLFTPLVQLRCVLEEVSEAHREDPRGHLGDYGLPVPAVRLVPDALSGALALGRIVTEDIQAHLVRSQCVGIAMRTSL